MLCGCTECPCDEPATPFNPVVGEWNPGMNEIRYVTVKGQESRIGFSGDANITEKFYVGGQWIVRYDKPIKYFSTSYDGENDRITELYLPDSIEDISITGSIMDLRELYIPEALNDMSAVLGDRMERFYGNHVSEDGRCVIVGGELMAVAAHGLKEYTVPAGVGTIGPAFRYSKLRKVKLPEGVTKLLGASFQGSLVEEVELPSSLDTINAVAFYDCKKIRKFSGPCKWISEDGLYLSNKSQYDGRIYMLQFAVGAGIEEYTIPKGIDAIDASTFRNCSSLKKLTFEAELLSLPEGRHFEGCDNLQAIYGPQVAEDNRSFVKNGCLYCVLCTGLKEYVIPEEVRTVNFMPLANAGELEVIRMSDEVKRLSPRPFYGASKLKEITLSARIEYIGGSFFETLDNLEKIYCRAATPPTIALYPESEVIRTENLKIYIPKGSIASYMESKYWEPLQPCLEEYEYTDLPQPGEQKPPVPEPEPEPEPEPDPDGYVSKDYSRDGDVAVWQKASKGAGIDLVLMGDAYSDRLVDNGTYYEEIKRACDAFFSIEPFKSYRDYFNVYKVDVVSRHEVYSPTSSTALKTWFGDGTRVGGDDETVYSYAAKAVSADRMDEVMVIVVMNKRTYAGTTYFTSPKKGDYGSGSAIAYFGAISESTTFASIVHHEAGGHGFAKLADEYTGSGQIPREEIDNVKALAKYGWYKNVDFTSDPSKVKWSGFISDERYASEQLGVYEGGLGYDSGLWRPTESGIMKNNKGGFNAPSREAIWYRIHKLAYGDEWEYDYEDFVEYDEVNRK